METLLTSILAFISTNIDDIFLLMLFFGNKRFKDREIVVGQLLGIATLIAISLTISFIGLVVDKAYIGLLGFIPVYFGVRDVIRLRANHLDGEEVMVGSKNNRNNIFTVAGATIANGGDNIGIYVPLFAALAWSPKLIMIFVFFILTGVWCWLARYSIQHPLVARTIERYGHILTPFVLILLGIYIVYESNTFSLLIHLAKLANTGWDHLFERAVVG